VSSRSRRGRRNPESQQKDSYDTDIGRDDSRSETHDRYSDESTYIGHAGDSPKFNELKTYSTGVSRQIVKQTRTAAFQISASVHPCVKYATSVYDFRGTKDGCPSCTMRTKEPGKSVIVKGGSIRRLRLLAASES
jgi:hypothetical protein